jgi:hypothetical protein
MSVLIVVLLITLLAQVVGLIFLLRARRKLHRYWDAQDRGFNSLRAGRMSSFSELNAAITKESNIAHCDEVFCPRRVHRRGR